MSRKKSLDELKAARAALDAQIKEMQREQLAAVARWVLRETSCGSLQELKAAGWSLGKKPPTDGGEGGNDEEGKDETAIKAFNPSSVWNG